MPMRRDQIFPDKCPRSVLRTRGGAALDALFQRAVELALASSLLAAGCVTEAEGGDPANGPGGLGVRAGASAQASAGSTALDGGKPAALAGRGGTRPVFPPTADGGGSVKDPDAAQPDASDEDAGADSDAGMAAAGGPVTTVSGPVCDGYTWKPLESLDPAEPIDYATLRVAYEQRTGMPANESASVGEACATASGASCRSELDALLAGGMLSFEQSCGMVGRCQKFIVTTAGDRVTRYATRDELLEFLGGINTPQEVLLLLDYDGYTINCLNHPAGSTLPPELGAAEVETSGDGFEATVAKLITDCPFTYARVQLRVSSDGVVEELSSEELPPSPACAGRRPEGWLGSGARATSALADHFMRMAELEAASVIAFDVLARELEHHGAPEALIARARAAADDEVRHAERTGELAARFGAHVREPEVAARPLRSLEALALDNAIEGCVRETYGAAVGYYQARSASDPEIAALMAELSRDEMQHALLALDIDTWLHAHLCDAARQRVATARATAAAQLSLELGAEPDATLQTLAGLPPAHAARRIHEALQAELWS